MVHDYDFTFKDIYETFKTTSVIFYTKKHSKSKKDYFLSGTLLLVWT